jgi:hypothetical protein
MKWYGNLLRAAAVTAALLLPAALWAQTDIVQAAKAQQQKDEQKKDAKKPHVWTNDDLPKATQETVSVPSVAPPAPPPSQAGESAAAPGQALAGQAAPGAKPAVDLKAAQDKVKNAQRDVDETKKVIQFLVDRMPSESGNRLAEDQGMMQRSQERLAGYEDNLKQAQKDLADAQPAQGQGQQGGQPAPPPPPQL